MWVTAYTDASFRDSIGGWSIWLRSGKGRIVKSGKCPELITNSGEAELYAALQAVQKAVTNWPEVKNILLISDCQQVVNRLASPLKVNPVETVTERIIRKASELLDGRRVKTRKVKGHQNPTTSCMAYLNTKVDKLAGKHTGRYK